MPTSARVRALHVLAFVVTASIAAAAPAAAKQTGPSVPGPRASGSIVEILHSSILKEERRVLVRLPRRYELDTTTRYPVLFKLDGAEGLDRYEQSIETLIASGAMPDVIVVAIPNNRTGRERDMTPPSLHQQYDPSGKMGTGEMGRGDRFLNFLEKELVPLIDERYRTTPLRVLAGHSRSALLTLHSLFSKPDLFQARFIFSAPLMRDEQRMIADARRFFTTHPEHRSFVYFNWGERENEGMNESCSAMQQLLAEAAPMGLRWFVERAPSADHQQTPLLAIEPALRALFADR
jgi:predicted alpha/beta superfamily hydrolase